MTTEATAEGLPATGKDPLVGLAYKCCKGPNRNHTIRVVERITTGVYAGRYQLESEDDGHRWTIDAENLARIFGDSTKRKCACLPIGDAAALVTAAVTATRATEAAPAEVERSAEPPDTAEAHPAAADAAEATQHEPDGEAGSPPAEEKAPRPRRRRAEAASSDAAPPAAGVIFHEYNRQGALF